MYIKINESRFQIAVFSEHSGRKTPDTIKVDCVAPSKYHRLKSDYQNFTDVDQWEAATSRKQEVIKALSLNIDKNTAEQLAAGLNFNNEIFPLMGDAYAHNMAAAQAYAINQGVNGRELLTMNGSYVHVNDIAGLVSEGDRVVTTIIKAAVDKKDALQNKTTAELIEML